MLAFEGDVKPAAEYQIVSGPTLNRKRITVYGEDKMLSTIDTIYTEPVTLSDISDTTNLRVAIAIPQGLRTEADSVDVEIILERFTEKKFMVPLHVKGVPEGYRLRLFPKEVEVSVRVGMNHFAEVPFITAAWAYPGVVEFILEQ